MAGEIFKKKVKRYSRRNVANQFKDFMREINRYNLGDAILSLA